VTSDNVPPDPDIQHQPPDHAKQSSDSTRPSHETSESPQQTARTPISCTHTEQDPAPGVRKSRVRIRSLEDQARSIGAHTEQHSVAIKRERPSEDPLYWGSRNRQRTVFIHLRALEIIWQHGHGSPRAEVGGFLIGCSGRDPQGVFTIVDFAYPALEATGSSVELEIPPESWVELHRALDENHPDRSCVGWYHTHPNLGIFLSGHDQFLHRHWFPRNEQVAIVADPAAGHAGIFVAEDGEVVSPARPESTVNLIPLSNASGVYQPTSVTRSRATSNEPRSSRAQTRPTESSGWRQAVSNEPRYSRTETRPAESLGWRQAVSNEPRSSRTETRAAQPAARRQTVPNESQPPYARIGTRDVTQPVDDGARRARRILIRVALSILILVGLVIALFVTLLLSREEKRHSSSPPICNPQALMPHAEVGDSASAAPRRPALVFTAEQDCTIDSSIVLTRPPDQYQIIQKVQGRVTHNGFAAPLPSEWDWCNGPSHLVVQNQGQPPLEREISAPEHCPHK
jgi:proteasome lid subunit RPN8/RPN11